nr:hypothetical protein [Tanacetum cinerariifolium]
MARLAFCDYHNMIAILEKYEHNIDFHQIVDFVEASPIRYALTINPTVYVSHIRQFWSTVRIETMDEGTKILATVDGKLRTISKLSIRRNLKLNDEEGISTLPDAELFENLALMGYNILPNQKLLFRKSLALPTAADELISPLGDDSQGEACPTVSGLEAGQDRANVIKTFTLPHDSTPRVTSLAADEGTQDLEIASLKARIKMLEDKDAEGAEPSGEDATIKGRSLETGEEAGVEKSTKRDSNDIEELVNVLTSLDATSILTSGVQVVSVPPATEVSTVGIPTVSGLVPTASPIFTTSSVLTPYSRCKGNKKMVESDTLMKKKLQEQINVHMAREMEEQLAREDQRMNEQISRDAAIARIHAEEELQMLIDGLDRNNETIAKSLCKSTQVSVSAKKATLQEATKRILHANFVPMASKEKGERFKRKGLWLEQSSAKKMKTGEDVSEEDLKEMIQLVPVEEVYVEALQVKHPIINWEIYSKGQRTYWKIIRLGGHTAVYQFFVDMLKHFDREDFTQLWNLKR